MSNDELVGLLAEGLEVEPGTLSPDTRIADVDEWTSIGWLSIMSLADERLGVQLDAQAIRGFKTVSDVTQYLQSKAA